MLIENQKNLARQINLILSTCVPNDDIEMKIDFLCNCRDNFLPRQLNEMTVAWDDNEFTDISLSYCHKPHGYLTNLRYEFGHKMTDDTH